MKQGRTKWMLVAAALVGVLGFVLYISANPSPHPALPGPVSSTQAKISWSLPAMEPYLQSAPAVTQIEVILSPGENKSGHVAFTSNLDLQKAVVEVEPTIAGFVRVEPASFGFVPSRKPQAVQIGIAIPSGTALGSYEGAIYLRSGSTILTRPLKVILNVWFSFRRELFGTPPTLSLTLLSADASTGDVLLGGGDTAQPTTPFTFDWGDGTITNGFFNQPHTYSDVTKNYVISVTAHYSSGASDTEQIAVWFVRPALEKQSFPADLSVTVPNQATTLTSTCCYAPPSLSFFDDTFFSAAHLRVDLEYVLSQIASIEFDLVNQDVQQVDGAFRQVILRNPSTSNAGPLWYTAPVAVEAGNSYITSAGVQYSSLFHEMGHNYTLNTPSAYRYGGKIDGNANAIYSETMAQIFQHTAAYELINNAQSYGLTAELVTDIIASVRSSMWMVRISYDDYVSAGMPFASWNDPSTPQDETFGTFMTLAFAFFKHAENDGHGYKLPLMRMMRLLQRFDPALAQRYDPTDNTTAADTFRATLMVAAMSYGFRRDLRTEFRQLNFPVDDATFTALIGPVPW